MAKKTAPRSPDVPDSHEPPLTRTQQRELARARKALTQDLDEFLARELECTPRDFIDEGWRVFEFADVSTRAIVDILRDDVVLRVEAPIMRVPADKTAAARLVRELLEVNFFTVGRARVALAARDVVAVAMLSATDITKDDIAPCLRDTATLASLLAEGLKKKYGPAPAARRATRAKASKA
ncbi:MAG: hypothetical protein JNM38_05010 [Acidobacteria bacterium]|nr:hypothetical protein [Acidobacteriota bacterium]